MYSVLTIYAVYRYTASFDLHIRATLLHEPNLGFKLHTIFQSSVIQRFLVHEPILTIKLNVNTMVRKQNYYNNKTKTRLIY